MRRIALSLIASLAFAACTDVPQASRVQVAETKQALGAGPQFERFRAFEEAGNNAYGIEGVLPPNAELADVYYNMNESERRGLAAWHLFGAYRGKFFRREQLETNNGGNMLRVLDSRKHDDRFERTGLINDPGCKKRTTPDQFGLYIDDCSDPYSAGTVGLRLRPNPDFDMQKWAALGGGDVNKAAEKWLKPAKDRFEWKSKAMEDTVAVEPPYEVVMTCTVCHAAPNPLAPPADVNKASWKNIVFALGNQFFKEDKVFVDGIPEDDFLHQALQAQHPGTSDTSRMANDHIFNPNVINAVFNLSKRPLHKERVSQFDAEGLPVYNADIKPETCDGETCEVDTYRVLKDGADSSGPSGAALRVYINIGACYDQFASNMDPVWGLAHPTVPGRLQTPVSRRQLELECPDYQRLLPYAPHIVNYLKFVKPYRLARAPGGADKLLDWNDPVLERGRQVFAEECATCHSSRQPEFPTGAPTALDTAFEVEFAGWSRDKQVAWLKDPTRVAWFKDQVKEREFFENNFLSDDKRYPISLLGSNSARSMGTNASTGHVWEEYASLTYRTMPAVDVPVYKFDAGLVSFEKTIKGPVGFGYYRTPSLWGVWSSAPFLHNNSLGDFNGGITVDDRLKAYQSGMEQLLGLKGRPTEMAKTSRFTALTNIPLGFKLPNFIPGVDLSKLALGLPIPPGTPIAMVANLEGPTLMATSYKLEDVLRILFEGPQALSELTEHSVTVFDPIENKGHTFGNDRSEADKRALIELLKSL